MTTSLKAVVEGYPQLHVWGYGQMRGLKGLDLGRGREMLLAASDDFERAVAWISGNMERALKFNGEYTSYGLKHIAEPECGYTCNGAWIAAMLACGFAMQVDAKGNGAYNPIFNAKLSRDAKLRLDDRRFGGR